jgi:RNase P/RNase MRP subunit POP5
LNFGDFGLAIVNLTLQGLRRTEFWIHHSLFSDFFSSKVKYFNDVTNMCILRSPREQFRMVWAALTFITKIENEPLLLRVIHVGGTLRSCQTHAIKFDRKMLHVMKKLKRKSHQNQTMDITPQDTLPFDL